MGKFQDLTGRRFGKLTVIAKSKIKQGHHICWTCQCDCGKTVPLICGDNLKNGTVMSCGCLRRENRVRMNTKHGKSKTRLYRIWGGIHSRCFNTRRNEYEQYGGRGITVCDEWKSSFEAFYEWAMANGYADNLTIERKDVNGDYCPENCCWITNQEQQNNRRTTHLLTYNGETHSIKEWAKITGINYSTLRNRINALKWDVAKTLTTKPIKKGKNQ